MNERAPYPTPEQPGEGDFNGIVPPEGDTGTYRFPNSPHHKENPTTGEFPQREEGSSEYQQKPWTPENKPAKDPNKVAKIIGVVTAAMVVIGGGTLAAQKVSAKSHNAGLAGNKRPSATGPAVPGEKMPTVPDYSPKHFTEQDVPLIIKAPEGYELTAKTGVEAFAASMQLDTVTYPTYVDVLRALPSVLTQRVNCGTGQGERSTYKDYKSEIGNQNGITGVCNDFYYPALAQALISENSASDPQLTNKFPRKDLIYGAVISELSEHARERTAKDPDYHMSLELDTTKKAYGIDSSGGVENANYGGEVYMVVKEEGDVTADNGKELKLGVVMSKQPNKDGMEAWMTDAAQWTVLK